ncbi:uncharacterized protein LOC121248025 [Juglans microcarpa x Juglans regia]|uniref:uncharacterized protein LOC121248025 n=1 Tax=Juglans microcarpa x Juglans regia TaxID=2249226 RepID=UPI001B7EE639|nr:uncharacterized protein LOC121248025 [Juglans microcarpa x Juglans regia]
MSDWGPVFVAVVLFILLTPGLLIQIPGKHQLVEFGNFQTSGVSILVHSILYFALICVFLLAVGVHVFMGQESYYDGRMITDPHRLTKVYRLACLQNVPKRLVLLVSSEKEMADWAPVLIGVVLFVLLTPGLLFQLPGHNRQLEFGSLKTNGKAVAVHTLIFFAIYAVLILVVRVHIYTG